jgi:hypothetical protein
MYDRSPPKGMTADECKAKYAEFLRNIPLFIGEMEGVARGWPVSCKQFLTNEQTNRVAWLGQAAMCHYSKISRQFRAGYCLLSQQEANAADEAAKQFLIDWINNEHAKNKNSGIRSEGPQGWLW